MFIPHQPTLCKSSLHILGDVAICIYQDLRIVMNIIII